MAVVYAVRQAPNAPVGRLMPRAWRKAQGVRGDNAGEDTARWVKVYLPAELLERVADAAYADGLSFSAYVRGRLQHVE